tara:strand:- start:1895 stop:2170 length:276 start_codon:yes stop_codon:yes gene_type:complete
MKKKIIKAVLGVMAAKKLLQNSQGARDIAGNLGIAPRLLADKYDKEEEEKQKQLKSQGMKHGGEAQGPENNVNVMRGTGIAVRGTKFQGVF